jgi:HSP20 family molecular chaperone IbpA
MSAARQLQLAKRENFFSDPLFKDIWSDEDSDLQKRLEAFKNRSALALSSKGETAHNLQVSCSNDKFMIQLELPGFLPEDFSLKTKDDVIQLEALHEAKAESESTTRKYVKEFKVPEGVQKDQLQSSYSSEGILTIQAPRVINAPEGAEVQEAMAAASKAYTTDDGKTSVKQDSQSASQMIAASTKSDDGSSSSSMSFSSSNMNSSSSTTSSSGGPGGAGGMSLDMDDMMKKMMGGMKMEGGGGSSMMSSMGGDMGGMGDMGSLMSSGSKMMSSSSSSVMSSSSSSTSSSSTSKLMSGGMSGMPSLLGNMPGLDIEELSTAGTEFSGPPAYTVTSPRPSVDNTASGMKFTVQPTADFKFQPQQEADCSVLLKLKKGDEYKLVLNMQSYNPENITVKLNGQELTVLAVASPGSTDDFKQTHVVPDGIDLDQMTSSFSADGVLVIKAPKKK